MATHDGDNDDAGDATDIAWKLTATLQGWGGPKLLPSYEAERRPATTSLVLLNRKNGPEQVMQLVEERAPNGYKVVTDVLSLKELEDIAANYKRVAGFQVEGLNAKPPIVQLPDARRASA